jgi:hypothetical protein
MTQTSLAAAADYADALTTARKAKNLLFWLLFFILVAQLSIFFAARYSGSFLTSGERPKSVEFFRYVTNPLTLLGFVFTIVLACDLLLIVLVMVMGRLLGVARLTSAFLWCVLLAVLMFPWQGFLHFPGINDESFRIPGVLYTWGELVGDARFNLDHPMEGGQTLLKWARFVGFPFVALVILMSIHFRSRRALKQAMGEIKDLPGERLL